MVSRLIQSLWRSIRGSKSKVVRVHAHRKNNSFYKKPKEKLSNTDGFFSGW